MNDSLIDFLFDMLEIVGDIIDFSTDGADKRSKRRKLKESKKKTGITVDDRKRVGYK